MKASGKYLAIILAALCARAASAFPAITVDGVAQRWPWNNKVDITYTVADGQDLANGIFYKIVFTASIAGQDFTIDGTKVGASACTGSHTVTWTPPPDLKTKSTECRMSAAIYTADAPSGDDYMVVNLMNGAVSYEGLLATQEASNERYTNNIAYKTDYLVLRRVPKGGTYRTGHSAYTGSNTAKDWTTDRDYYIGIFQVTRAQYKKLVGSVPGWAYGNFANSVTGGNRDLCPLDSVTWEELRGTGVSPTNTVAAKDDGTFLERLNAKTLAQDGMKGFDLPTEVMFEIAARAGAETAYFFGDGLGTADAMVKQYAWGNTSTLGAIPAGVGLKLPNGWGLYDVIGNAGEWLRDDDSLSDLANAADPWTPACSAGTTVSRRVRGYGLRNGYAHDVFKASYRTSGNKDTVVSSSNWTVDSSWRSCRVSWIAQ